MSKAFFLFSVIFLSACAPGGLPIHSFQECADAGYPIMESYPRQCRANGQTFVEDIPEQPVP